jgi:hypothetical protein
MDLMSELLFAAPAMTMIAIFGLGPLEWTILGLFAVLLLGRKLIQAFARFLGRLSVQLRRHRDRPDDEEPGLGSPVPNPPRPPKLSG